MPLINGKRFVPFPPPPSLSPEERVFQVAATGEVFRNYESFYKRSLLCKSLLWSCEFTGKNSLTLEEAKQSEEEASKMIEAIPEPVKKAILSMIHSSQRVSTWQLFDEVWSIIKDRYYVGEQVEAALEKKFVKSRGKVVEVVAPPPLECRGVTTSPVSSDTLHTGLSTSVNLVSEEILSLDSPKSTSANDSSLKVESTPVTSEEGRKVKVESTPVTSEEGRKVKVESTPVISEEGRKVKSRRKLLLKSPLCPDASLDPSLFRYKVELKNLTGTSTAELPGQAISRVRNSVTRERLRLFIRYSTYKQVNNDKFPILVKDRFVVQYNLGERPFSSGPIEQLLSTKKSPTKSAKKRSLSQTSLDAFFTESSPPKKNRVSSSTDSKTPERVFVSPRRQSSSKKPPKKWSKEALRDMLKKKKITPKRRQKLNEELKKILTEEKEKKKAERDAQRQIMKEERDKEREKQRELRKPREDTLLEDSKPLPNMAAIPFKLPPELFADAVMILECLRLFGPLCDIQDSRLASVTFSRFEECLLENDPNCTLYHVLRFLLLALFVTMEDEEEKELTLDQMDKMAAIQEVTPCDCNEEMEIEESQQSKERDSFIAVAKLHALWPLKCQGVPLRNLPLDYNTLSEILRLHLLSSGAVQTTTATNQFRHYRRGGYSQQDDPGIDFCIRHPQLLSRLSRKPVYDLSAEDKLSLLSVLCNQLMTYSVVRDALSENNSSLKAVRKKYRFLQFELERLKKVSKRKVNGDSESKMNRKEVGESLGKQSCENSVAEEQIDKADIDQAKDTEVETATENVEEIEEELAKLSKKIIEYSRAINLRSLGSDRWHRMYWYFPSMAGIYVERMDSTVQSPGKMAAVVPLPRWSYLPAEEEQLDDLISSLNARGMREHALREQLILYKEEIITTSEQTMKRRPKECKSDHNPYSSSEDYLEINLREQLLELEDNIYCGNLGHVRSEDSRSDWRKCIETSVTASKHKTDITQDEHNTTVRTGAGSTEVMEAGSTEDMEAGPTEDMEAGPTEVMEAGPTEDMEAGPTEDMEAGPTEDMEARSTEDMEAGPTEVMEAGPTEDMEAGPTEDMEAGPTEDMEARSTGGSETNYVDASQVECSKRSNEGSPSDSRVSTPFVNPIVKELLKVLGQIEEGVEQRFLKLPLGNDLDDSDKRKKRLSQVQYVKEPCIASWRSSLKSSTNFSQLYLHLYTLDGAVNWSKSLQNIRCRRCRKKGGDEYLLLCDGCDNGFHTYCLDPPLMEVPEGDWYCSKCKPASPVKLRRISSMRPSMAEESGESSDESDTLEEQKTTSKSKRQKNRSHLELPRRSTRIHNKKYQLSEDGSSEEEILSESGSDSVDVPIELMEETERVRDQLRSAQSGSRAFLSKVGHLQEALLTELISHPDGWMFEALPKKSQNPGYYKVIREPLSLQTLKVKVTHREEMTIQDFIDNVIQIFTNCYAYYSLNSEECSSARRLEEYFNCRIRELDLLPKKKKRKSTRNGASSSDDLVADCVIPEDLLSKTYLAVLKVNDCPPGTRVYQARSSALHECLIEELYQHPRAAIFQRLPTRKQEPAFYETVKDPIDLQGLKVQAKKQGFVTNEQLFKELSRMFQNTKKFYGKKSDEAEAATAVESFLSQRLSSLGLTTDKRRARRKFRHN